MQTQGNKLLDILKSYSTKSCGEAYDKWFEIDSKALAADLFSNKHDFNERPTAYVQQVATLLRILERCGKINLAKDSGRFSAAMVINVPLGNKIQHIHPKMTATRQNMYDNAHRFRTFYQEERDANPSFGHRTWLDKASERFHEKVESGAWRYIKPAWRSDKFSQNQMEQTWLAGYITNGDRYTTGKTFEDIRPKALKPVVSSTNKSSSSTAAPVLDYNLLSKLIKESIKPLENHMSIIDNLLTEALKRIGRIDNRVNSEEKKDQEAVRPLFE